MPAHQRATCVYCGHGRDLTPSCLVPDGTLYPGVQMMCASAEACHLRIHVKYHDGPAWPECVYCQQSAAAAPSEPSF